MPALYPYALDGIVMALLASHVDDTMPSVPSKQSTFEFGDFLLIAVHTSESDCQYKGLLNSARARPPAWRAKLDDIVLPFHSFSIVALALQTGGQNAGQNEYRLVKVAS